MGSNSSSVAATTSDEIQIPTWENLLNPNDQAMCERYLRHYIDTENPNSFCVYQFYIPEKIQNSGQLWKLEDNYSKIVTKILREKGKRFSIQESFPGRIVLDSIDSIDSNDEN